MTTKITGYDAIKYAAENGLNLNKFADPTEDETWGLSIEEAKEVAAEDPGLIWVDTDHDPEDGSNLRKEGQIMTDAFKRGVNDYAKDKSIENPFPIGAIIGQSVRANGYYWHSRSQEREDWCWGWMHAAARSFDPAA